MTQDGTRAIVWVVDDLDANHELVLRSLPLGYEAACELVSLTSAQAAIEQVELALLADPGSLPDVIFMDFFLGDDYGHEVTRKIRAAFLRKDLAGPFIVGHSSSPSASLEIVRAGGDVAIEKDRAHAVSAGVRRLFPDLEALRSYAGRARRGKNGTR